MNLTSKRLLQILQGFPAANHYHLAFSGGMDSTVLLQLLADVRDSLPGNLHALHIHHGLQMDADAWGLHCRQLCKNLSVPLQQIDLNLLPKSGESLEALAREARYSALAAGMQHGDMLLTAQHQDDQAETLLLQLLRGSGPSGLAAMPRLIPFGQGWLARPLLDFSRAQLEAYARNQRLNWVEDPSNRNLRFDRNYIRHRIMPLLQQRWPSAANTIARSARLSGEQQVLVDERAAQDLVSAQGPWPGTLSISTLRALSAPRMRSLLRHWVREQGGTVPGSRHLQRIEQECLAGRGDAQPQVRWKDNEVRRFRDGLFLLRPLPPHDPDKVIPWPDQSSMQLPANIGELVLEPAETGIAKRKWLAAKVEVRFRQGGERCIPAGSKHHRSVKKLFQEWAIPPWGRARIPLIYLDNQLAVIPGHLICEPFMALPEEEALRLQWFPMK